MLANRFPPCDQYVVAHLIKATSPPTLFRLTVYSTLIDGDESVYLFKTLGYIVGLKSKELQTRVHVVGVTMGVLASQRDCT